MSAGDPSRVAQRKTGLTALCLGGDHDRGFRHLAWMCSICALFLAVGIAGISRQAKLSKASFRSEHVVPVVFTPAEVAPKSKAEPHSAEPRREAESRVQSPIRVVAVNAPGEVATTPVSDAAILTPVAQAAIPTAQPASAEAPEPTRFDPGAGTPETPRPVYPALALRRGYEGTVVVRFTVAESGQIAEARLGQSSGFTVLDDAALDVVKHRWRFPPGDVRHHFVEIVFQLK